LRDDRRLIVGDGSRYVDGAVGRREEAFERVRPTITPNPQETLDNVMGKDDRSYGGKLLDGIGSIIDPPQKK
jgi:hypothetical protein